ncbi:MAG: hypothetical protein V2B14_01620 [bacterium]
MKKIKKILTIALGILIISAGFALGESSQAYTPTNLIQADIQSQRIPVGTKIKIRMESPVNTHNSQKGDMFLASIIEDIKIKNNVILPAGTIIRGNAGNIKKNGYLSRSGELSLNLDHIVTPLGKQALLIAKISEAKNLTLNGSISAGGGYLDAVDENLNQGTDLLINILDYGMRGGLSIAGGIPVILTAPCAAIIGTTAGGAVFFSKSAVAIFKKGDNVKINPGDILEITLIEPLDIPVN